MQTAFPCLESLQILGLDNMKKSLGQSTSSRFLFQTNICGGKIRWKIVEYFSILYAKKVTNSTSSERGFISLEKVFDVNANANANEGVTITRLSQLILKLLPKVEKIWNKDLHGILSFQNLKSMMIDQCQSLKNLFPASLVGYLGQLEKLHVSSSGIEEIVVKDINGILDTEPTFVFPKVTSLELYNLHQLRNLYPGAHTSQWPLLDKPIVNECPLFEHSNIMREVSVRTLII